MTGGRKLRIGFMPLVDAAALIVAVDKGFAEAEGLEIELYVRRPGRTFATNSPSAISTPRIFWPRWRSPPRSASAM